jgi:hypothetical protein
MSEKTRHRHYLEPQYKHLYIFFFELKLKIVKTQNKIIFKLKIGTNQINKSVVYHEPVSVIACNNHYGN